jgi:hypothetical protein
MVHHLGHFGAITLIIFALQDKDPECFAGPNPERDQSAAPEHRHLDRESRFA